MTQGEKCLRSNCTETECGLDGLITVEEPMLPDAPASLTLRSVAGESRTNLFLACSLELYSSVNRIRLFKVELDCDCT